MEVGVTVVRRRWVERSWRTLWRARNRDNAISFTLPVKKDDWKEWMTLQARLRVDPNSDCVVLFDCVTLEKEAPRKAPYATP